MHFKKVLLALISSSLLFTLEAECSYASPSHSKILGNPALKDCYLGNLHFKPFVQGEGLYGFSVYRGNKLILHKAAKGKFINALYIGLPDTGHRALPTHTFDGGMDDFITDNEHRATTPLVDLNGDGVPDLIVGSSDSMRTDAYEIYSLGVPVKMICKSQFNLGGLRFIDLDHDGKYEALGYDKIFHYWCESGARSPEPPVVLEFGKNGLQLSTSFMRTPAPSEARQKELVAHWFAVCGKGSDGTKPGGFWLDSDVWRDMLYLIYSGNSKIAFALLDKFWKPGRFATNLNSEEHASKEAFICAFVERLNKSPYIDGLRQLNPDDPLIKGANKTQLSKAKQKTIFLNRDCAEDFKR